MILSIKKIIPFSGYHDRCPPAEYQSLKEEIKKEGIITPLLLRKDFILLNGYKRLKIAKEFKLEEVPVYMYPFSLKDMDLKRVFEKGYSVLEDPLEQAKRIKYVCLFFPTIFITKAQKKSVRLMEHYAKASQEIHLSVRQLQRMKRIYALARAKAKLKNKDRISSSELRKAIQKINRKRLAKLKDMDGRSLFSELQDLYYSINSKKQKDIRKRIKEVFARYEKHRK